MKISTRIIASLIALVAATSVSTLASGAAAMAVPSKIPPILTLMTPRITVTVSPTPFVLVGNFVDVTVTANWSDGSPLAGNLVVSEITSTGTTVLASANAIFFHTGYLYSYPVTSPGDVTFQAHYAPPAGTFGSTATGSAVAHDRISGYPAVALAVGTSTAGTATPITATLTLPASGAAFAVGGAVQVDVDALGTLASCIPARTSATTAGCTTSLPANLTAGPHAITGNFVGSTTFLNGSYASTFTVAPARAPAPAPARKPVKAPAKPATSTATTPAPSAPVTASPIPTATAIAAPAQSDPTLAPQPHALPVTNASSTVPLSTGIAMAILVLALVAVAALVTVAIIRSRRARTTV